MRVGHDLCRSNPNASFFKYRLLQKCHVISSYWDVGLQVRQGCFLFKSQLKTRRVSSACRVRNDLETMVTDGVVDQHSWKPFSSLSRAPLHSLIYTYAEGERWEQRKGVINRVLHLVFSFHSAFYGELLILSYTDMLRGLHKHFYYGYKA